MHRYELSERQWARIAPLFQHTPHPLHGGCPCDQQRLFVNAILWILHTGAPWRDLPERYGPWPTVFYHFNRWRQDGTWSRLVTSLLDELDDAGQIDHDLWCVDGSVIRASRAAAGARKKGGAFPDSLAGEPRRKCRNRKIMRSGDRGAVMAPRFMSSAIATAASSPSMLPPGSGMRAKHLRQRWPGGSCTCGAAKDVGPAHWQGTKGTATHVSDAGVLGGRSRP